MTATSYDYEVVRAELRRIDHWAYEAYKLGLSLRQQRLSDAREFSSNFMGTLGSDSSSFAPLESLSRNTSPARLPQTELRRLLPQETPRYPPRLRGHTSSARRLHKPGVRAERAAAGPARLRRYTGRDNRTCKRSSTFQPGVGQWATETPGCSTPNRPCPNLEPAGTATTLTGWGSSRTEAQQARVTT